MNQSFSRWCAAAPLLLLTTSLSAQIWSEEFDVDGPPNPNVWSYDLGAGGWGNNELQTYTNNSANVRVENGHLVITALRQGNGFTSARIKTEDKLTLEYGTVEARIQVPDLANGLWPAFWTLGSDFSTVGWPDCGEIDVMEMGSSSAISAGEVNRRCASTAHWEVNGQRALYGLSRLNATNLSNGFHVWRLEWTPTSLTTYIDGQWIWTMNISNPSSFDGEEFHNPHFFILNLAVGGDYPGIYNSGGITANTPAEYRIDYIRIWDNGFTTLGGSSLAAPATSTIRTGPGNFNSAYSCTPPVLGGTMAASITANGLPYTSGGVLAHLSPGVLPFRNYTVLVDLASPHIFSLPFTTFQFGFAFWSVPIPNNQSFAGFAFSTQAVMVGPDIAFTNAADLVLGN